MTLQNLLAINKLQPHTPTCSAILKLLRAAERNLTDARLDALSTDNRFDAAYKTNMQCAMLGLWANGYRTFTNQPGHHQTAPKLTIDHAIAQGLCHCAGRLTQTAQLE